MPKVHKPIRPGQPKPGEKGSGLPRSGRLADPFPPSHTPWNKGLRGVRSKKDLPTSPPVAREATAAGEPAAAAPAPLAVDDARASLRVMIASLPEGSQQRKSLELMLARDEAREAHAKAEEDLQTRFGKDAHIPVPVILRERSEKAGRELLRQLDHTLDNAAQARDPRAKPTAMELLVTHEAVGMIPRERERAEREAKERAKLPEHTGGDVIWFCRDCADRESIPASKFNGPTLPFVRRKAAAERGWRWCCPRCGSGRVQLFEGSEYAVAV